MLTRSGFACAALLLCLTQFSYAQSSVAQMLPKSIDVVPWTHAAATPFHTELDKLTATRVGLDVQLEWITLSEIGNRGFEVQRASSESRGWQQVVFVPGGSDGRLTRNYSALDRRVPPEDLRYMLRMVGDDGMIQYSQIITVPVSGILRSFAVNLETINAETGPRLIVELLRNDVVSLQVTDFHGNVLEQIVSQKKLSVGKHDFLVDCSRYTNGEYNFLLSTSEGQYRRSYLHQR
ncbi:MAG: hypothetical protein WBQ23_07225 [Bacteroidota bacterium]